MRHAHKNGFTLLELLVVISIIGTLASVVLASLNTSREKAQYAAARTEITQLMRLTEIAKGESGNLPGITGSVCTECACRNKGNIQNLPQSDTCRTTYLELVSKLNTAANGYISIPSPPTDPWGAPYLFNENEGEGGLCVTDNILSAGPNGLYYDSDDINVNVPARSCSPAVSHHPNMNW
jgi:prepilin-type N-terminal cleavage/methylation domain-containing protein